MIFVQKNGNFSIFLFSAKSARKRFFTIFLIKKTPFQTIKTSSYKSEKIEIFPTGKIGIFSKGLVHDFCKKKWQFFHLFSLGKINHENVFHDILDIKNVLLDYNNIKLKK